MSSQSVVDSFHQHQQEIDRFEDSIKKTNREIKQVQYELKREKDAAEHFRTELGSLEAEAARQRLLLATALEKVREEENARSTHFLNLLHQEKMVAEKTQELERNRREMTRRLVEQNQRCRSIRRSLLDRVPDRLAQEVHKAKEEAASQAKEEARKAKAEADKAKEAAGKGLDTGTQRETEKESQFS